MKDFIIFLPNYTEKLDSWSNNFLNLEVSSKRKLSEITPDLKTILIISQVLDNAFHFIQCSYVIIVNISISGPQQKSDHHSRWSFLPHSPLLAFRHLLNQYSSCNHNKLYSRHHELQSKIKVLFWKDVETSQGDTKKIHNYSACTADIEAGCVQSEWRRKGFSEEMMPAVNCQRLKRKARRGGYFRQRKHAFLSFPPFHLENIMEICSLLIAIALLLTLRVFFLEDIHNEFHGGL